MKLIKYCTFFIFLILLNFTALISQDYELPVYRMEMEPAHLALLYENPLSNDYYPATISIDDKTYDCEIRVRGGTARNLPKLGFKIKFKDANNIFSAGRINFSPEYRDSSMMRNYLSLKLFQYLGFPSPNTSYINLIINGGYAGVFLQMEEVDKNFLIRNKKRIGNIYKASNHGGSMAPLLRYSDYTSTWEKKIGDTKDYSDIQLLFSKFFFYSAKDFENSIASMIDFDNAINYFAIEYAITNFDGITKNIFLYINPESSLIELFPWDNDASLGNDWQGNYMKRWSKSVSNGALNSHVLFRRLMENDDWRQLMLDRIDIVITDGFDYLHLLADSTFSKIKNDLFRDTTHIAKRSSIEEDAERIHKYLDERKQALADLDSFDAIKLSEPYCSNYFPGKDSSTITFRIKSERAQNVRLIYLPDLDYSRYGDERTRINLNMYDDGRHDDLEAGDLIYGIQISNSELEDNYVPFVFNGDGSDYPYNGLASANYFPTIGLVINRNSAKDNIKSFISINNVYKLQQEYLAEIKNNAPDSIDLSFCYFRCGNYYQNFIFRYGTIIPPGETLLLTSDITLGQNMAGNIFFDIKPGDTLRLLSNDLEELVSKRLDEFSVLGAPDTRIVINEINYHSSDSADAGDWIELYNPEDSDVDISGWYLQDSQWDNRFRFPVGTIIKPNDYLVICRDTAKFLGFFSDVRNYIGELGFGLSGGGEIVRLKNAGSEIVDIVPYDDNAPWPELPDGLGPTLELINPDLNNVIPDSWQASVGLGTPGRRNSSYRVIDTIKAFKLYRNYPNPFFGQTRIDFDILEESDVEIEILDMQGGVVNHYEFKNHPAGKDFVFFEAGGYAQGLYFYRLLADSKIIDTKKMLLLKY